MLIRCSTEETRRLVACTKCGAKVDEECFDNEHRSRDLNHKERQEAAVLAVRAQVHIP